MILEKRRLDILISLIVLIFCVSETFQTRVFILQYPSKLTNIENVGPLTSLLRNPLRNFLNTASEPKFTLPPHIQKYLNAIKNNNYNQINLSDRHFVPLLLIAIKQQNEKIEKNRIECLRIFGSIYGTKDEKVKCLEDLKKYKLERDKMKSRLPSQNFRTKGQTLLKRPFVDYTRIADDYFGFDRAQRSDFSTDYIDFDDLRSEKPDKTHENSDTNTSDDSRKKYYPSLKNFRKYFRRWKLNRKNNHNDHIKQRSYSSDSDSFSENDEKHVKAFKPKRFQVIKNIHKSLSDENQNYSFEEVKKKPKSKSKTKTKKVKYQSSFEETTKSSKYKNKKPYSSSDESDSDQSKNTLKKDNSESDSSKEVVKKKPAKSKSRHKKISKSSSEENSRPKNSKKEVYLQGHRVINPLDGRKRLEHFLPKRFYWNDEEFKNLGYYWFNGPQGNYPFHRIRP